jgi:hypothetical protein
MSKQNTVGLHVFGREVWLTRSMKPSDEPVAAEGSFLQQKPELLMSLYSEVCTSWRSLVDVRFKLLGLVPAVSGVALGTLLSGDGLSAGAGIAIAVFGLVVTLSLFVYEQRNSQLHDELISRGRRIEKELGITVGQFLGRPGSWKFVKHDTAIGAIYIVTAAAWLAGAVDFVTRL